MKNRIFYILLVKVLCISIATGLYAQELNEEMRRWLREQIIQLDSLTPLQQQQQPSLNFPQIQHQLQQPEILRISPTTRLPSYLDRLQIADSTELILLRNMFDNLNFGIENIPSRTMIPRRQGIISGDFCIARAIERRRHKRHREQLDRLGIEWRHLQDRWDMREIYELVERTNQLIRETKDKEN